ncbi:MAG: DUF805 domain-containing protein [Kiritimatiellae bacterium]|nr:DUF805 domain-containing protein [Kiritimatiellia bacterium]
MEAWKRGWSVSTEGRASRSEYCWRGLSFLLEVIVLLLVWFLLGSAAAATSNGRDILPETVGALLAGMVSVVAALCLLYQLIAGFCLCIRRLHDQNLSGLWMFVWIIPPFGAIFAFRAGTAGPNKYGQVPGVYKST